METRILRFERSQNSSGSEEIFMHVEAMTETELATRAEWLTQEEVDLINEDESNKIVIAQGIARRALLLYRQSLLQNQIPSPSQN